MIRDDFKVVNANANQLDSIMQIQEAMYGKKYCVVESTFKSCVEVFPLGAFIARETRDLGLVKGFIITERLRDAVAVPYVHDAHLYHVESGPYLNVAGFGVLGTDSAKRTLASLLYYEMLELARKKSIPYCLVVCSGNETDVVEMQVLTDYGFSFLRDVEWEILPGRVIAHELWIWRS